jgi:membrane carboxypeptidase/penicillin-binding protein
MREALLRSPERVMARPPGIVEYRINPQSGLIANNAARDTVFEKFDIDYIPEREADTDVVDSFDPANPATPQRPSGPIF